MDKETYDKLYGKENLEAINEALMSENLKPIKGKESLPTDQLPGIVFTRSMIYKKRIAPKGCVFLVAKYKHPKFGDIYSMMKLIYTAGLTDEAEQEFKNELGLELKEHFKL